MAPEHDQGIEDRFRYGQCYPMAYALALRLGWHIESLVVDLPGGLHVVHAWVVDPEGRAFDAGGYFERDALREEYLTNTSRKWSNDRIESFATVDEYLSRLAEACGDPSHWVDYYDNQFLAWAADAERAIEAYIRPRYLPQLAEGARPSPR